MFTSALLVSGKLITIQMKKGDVFTPLLVQRLPVLPIKDQCITGKERRIRRWEHEHILKDMQRRLDEHPFGTIKSSMGDTHFQMKTLKRVGTEMELYVLAYNIKRVIDIIGIRQLMAAMMPA